MVDSLENYGISTCASRVDGGKFTQSLTLSVYSNFVEMISDVVAVKVISSVGQGQLLYMKNWKN